MIQANFTVSPTAGYVVATDFTVTNNTTAANGVQQYTWDIGYGDLIYNVKNPVLTYPFPGTYTVSLTAIDKLGNTSTTSKQISANFAYRDYLTFTQIPERYADPGKATTEPFKISVVSTNVDKPLIVDLFAANSKSTPYGSVPDKWSFLTPTWKFTDVNSNVVTSLSVTPTPVYVNNRVVAISGTAEFYYIDSMSVGYPVENCPILIIATLQTQDFTAPLEGNIYDYSSYANNETVRAGLVWQVNDLFPNLLKVTGNYVDDIYPDQWQGIKTPTIITCHSNRSLRLPGAEDSTSDIIFSYPFTNTIGNIQPIDLTLTNLTPLQYSIDEAPLYFQSTDERGFREGGYVFTTVTALTSVSSTSIVAQTTAYTGVEYPEGNKFVYPYGYSPNVPVWVSNPEKNTLNKITLIPYPDNCKTLNYFKEKGVLIDGSIKTYNVPYLDNSNTFNYNMSGFSGIYGMAIDPRNYDLIACDAELDKIYRFSNTGELLKTFDLSSIGDYDAQQKLYNYWTWTTSTEPLTSTLYLFYGTSLKSFNPSNYIMCLGGAIQPIELYYISDLQGVSFYTPKLGKALPSNARLDLIQIFNPALPSKYIDSISHWTTSSATPTTTFTLSGSPSLSANPGYYIVSVDGVLQSPDSYTVSNYFKTIEFTSTVPTSATVHVVYLPEINPPATWTQTYSYPTTSFLLTGSPNYIADDKSCFIVNVGGVLQAPVNYNIDIRNQQLTFSSPLPVNTTVSVTQISVPDVVDIPAAYTPSYVSLDKNYNIWVSLFNTVSVLKFDEDFNLLFSVAPTDIRWDYRYLAKAPDGVDYQSSLIGYQPRYTAPPDALPPDINWEEFFLKPPVVETDRDNNCWVTYANPLCCLLVKYSETGDVLTQIKLDQYSTPVGIAINSDNNVWVSNTNNSVYTYTTLSGSLELYDTNTSELLDKVTGISRPGDIAVDRNDNVWFTHSTRRIGYYNSKTTALSTWTLNLTGGFSLFTIPSATLLSALKTFDEVENQQDTDFGGLAVDVFDRVWILDNLQNYAWVISATPNFDLAPIRYFKIRPDVNLGYYVDVNGETYTDSIEGSYYRSAQAAGDWTGNRWYQKYIRPQSLSSVSLSGTSSEFTVTPFENKNQIRRVNESFNNAEYLKSLALPENLQNNPVLFDQFFAASVGTGYLSANQDLGQTVYERIANFVNNHSNVDTCNIEQLLSLAEQTGVPASDYSAVYPTDIINMIDIASVPRAKLWGLKDEVPLLPQSVGEKYDILTATVSAGDNIILKNKFDSTLSLIKVPLLSGVIPVYPLSSFEGYGFVQPVTVNYLFYKVDPVYSGNYIENIIDWSSQFTTQSPTASTLEEWYGEDGAIENAFRYILTKNLFLK